jgi:hypothetical protein
MNDTNPGNQRTVFVVQVDYSKDISDAKRFGQLQAVFSRPRRPYDTSRMIARARRVLSRWQPGDYLLMVGDPALCAVCMVVASEYTGVVNLLSWERERFAYQSQIWDFEAQPVFAEDSDDFDQADD